MGLKKQMKNVIRPCKATEKLQTDHIVVTASNKCCWF